ncbi:MAG: PrsW family intramembrane metalloprotease [Bacteroidales bacterium]|nr:PrsW family intramembrane metalloprotease [Bacteroidales bacterium]
MIVNYTIALILGPLIALLIYLLARRSFGKDYYNAIIASFLLGIVSVLLVIIFQYIASYYGLDWFRNLRRIVFYSFVVMGFGSELGKFLVLRYYAFSKKNFNSPLDSIFYSVMISMGFTFIGNVLYFIMPVYTEIDFTYSITVVFANFFFAIILGFFVGLAKSRENRFVDSMTGLLAASFFHALYNFCFITKDMRLLLFLSIGTFVVVILLLYKALELHEEHRRLKHQ